MPKKQPKGDYEIGYGKPPKQHQFPKGFSGNLKGKPKGAKNVKTDLEEELREQVEINDGGKVKRVTKQRLLIKAQVNKAIKGGDKAAAIILNLKLKLDELGAEAKAAGVQLDPDEQDVLDALTKRLLRRASAIDPKPSDKANGDDQAGPAKDDHKDSEG